MVGTQGAGGAGTGWLSEMVRDARVVALRRGAPLRFHPGYHHQSREVLPVGTKEAPSQSERRVAMGQGAHSSVFAKG